VWRADRAWRKEVARRFLAVKEFFFAFSGRLSDCKQTVCQKNKTDRVQAIFEATFREFGMPTAIRTDNGAPFASRALTGLSRLAVWWIKLAILPERIADGHPEQNARPWSNPTRKWQICARSKLSEIPRLHSGTDVSLSSSKLN
jgi:hypothetical protein